MAEQSPQSSNLYTATSAFGVLPTPPRIPLPAPLVENDLSPNTQYIYERGSEFAPFHGRLPQSGSLDWKYKSRHTAQEILPTLWIGPTGTAKDTSFIKEQGFTLLIGLHVDTIFSRAAQNTTDVSATSIGVESLSFPVPTLQSLISTLPEIQAAINKHLSDIEHPDRRVLLHCETGNERCPAVAAAYLMTCLRDTDHMRAMSIVQSQRFSANFDEERKSMLQCYWDIVRARREAGGEQASTGGAQAVKRGRDEFEAQGEESGDGEMSAEINPAAAGADDRERFEGRNHASPYVDLPKQNGGASATVAEVVDTDMGDG